MGGQYIKKGGPEGSPAGADAWPYLEVEPETELQLPLVPTGRCACDDPESRGGVQTQGRIARLEVIEHVRDLDAERRADAFLHHEILGDLRVDVPGREAAEVPVAAARGVVAEDQAAELAVDGVGIGEHV